MESEIFHFYPLRVFHDSEENLGTIISYRLASLNFIFI